MATCGSIYANVKIVRLLLEAGADPTRAQGDGYTPLHAVAFGGRVELVDMLYAAAPANLSRCALNGATPLYVACTRGHERVVSRLLSLGAIQPDGSDLCPLATAAHTGYVGIVRVLISQGGMRAVGGKAALAGVLLMVTRSCRARILRLLLTGDEEQRRSEWANSSFCGGRLLHFAADCCNPAAVSILLEAGADEAARDSEGRLPRDVVEIEFGQDVEVEMDRGGKVAIRRMLQRGQAYRARSWAWPSDEEAGAGSSGDGDTAAAAAAAAASTAVLSSRPAVKTPPVVGVRIFRPKEGSSSKFFVRLIGRYCEMD